MLGGGDSAPAAAPTSLPSLTLALPESVNAGEPRANVCASIEGLDTRLHGATLPDQRLGPALRQIGGLDHAGNLGADGTTVLATCNGVPTWSRSGVHESALMIPAELGPREALRERLCDRRSAALLPLLHFLRAQTEAIRWQPPAVHASLLFDDPNLHWPSYGFVKLVELGAHAREHGYHVALATVPLDAWFAHPTALRALRESDGAISLLVHGNDHDGGELGRGLRSPHRRCRRSSHGAAPRGLLAGDPGRPAPLRLRGDHNDPALPLGRVRAPFLAGSP